jgi:hypothetical protein
VPGSTICAIAAEAINALSYVPHQIARHFYWSPLCSAVRVFRGWWRQLGGDSASTRSVSSTIARRHFMYYLAGCQQWLNFRSLKLLLPRLHFLHSYSARQLRASTRLRAMLPLSVLYLVASYACLAGRERPHSVVFIPMLGLAYLTGGSPGPHGYTELPQALPSRKHRLPARWPPK